MSEERIAELVAALKLDQTDRMVINVDMGRSKDAFVIVEGDNWWSLVRGPFGWVTQRKGTFKAK